MSAYLHGTAVVLGVDNQELLTPEEKHEFAENYRLLVKTGLVAGSLVFGLLGAGLWSAHRVIGGILGVVIGAPLGAVGGGVLVLYPLAKLLEQRKKDTQLLSKSSTQALLPASVKPRSTKPAPDPEGLFVPF